jgi:hypothetical protein
MIGYMILHRALKESLHHQSIIIKKGFPTAKFVKPKRAHHNNQVYQRERITKIKIIRLINELRSGPKQLKSVNTSELPVLNQIDLLIANLKSHYPD